MASRAGLASSAARLPTSTPSDAMMCPPSISFRLFSRSVTPVDTYVGNVRRRVKIHGSSFRSLNATAGSTTRIQCLQNGRGAHRVKDNSKQPLGVGAELRVEAHAVHAPECQAFARLERPLGVAASCGAM